MKRLQGDDGVEVEVGAMAEKKARMDEVAPHPCGFTTEAVQQTPIAIIGYAYRLPGDVGETDDKVWQFFEQRKSLRVDLVESGRYDKGQVPWDGQANPFKHASRFEGAFLDKKEDSFDPQFFQMNAADAGSMDAQHKLGLVTSAEALENAGIDFTKLCGSDTGVFAGTQVGATSRFVPTFGWNEYSATSSSLSMMANRISFFLNLNGPSISYATACSAFISAMHGAVSALTTREVNLGLLVAATVHYGHAHNPSFNQLGVLSPDGACKSFDDDANGFMPSDGAFCYVLKRLDEAERDNNQIFGVIRGVHITSAGPDANHIGFAAGRSLTTPTVEGQVQALIGAYSRAGIDYDRVSYLECHATGTKVGDKVEATALGEVFNRPSRKRPLFISSSRSNFGHMEASSSGLSLLKTLLMFQNRTFLPLSDHFKKPNSSIPFSDFNLVPLATCVPFPAEPVVVGINSFGFGGSNGHAVIEEYQKRQDSPYLQPITLSEKYHTFLLSAKSAKGLYKSAMNILSLLSSLPSHLSEQEALYHLAGNLAVRRTPYPVRKYISARSLEQLRGQLQKFADQINTEASDIPKELAPVTINEQLKSRLCFIFPGQGSQWKGCGVSLYASDTIFKNTVDTIDGFYRELSRVSLCEVMHKASQEELDQCVYAQPITFMIQVGLVEMCRSVGINPSCIVGHSAGELAAVYASGAISLKDMVKVVYERAKLQQTLSGSGRLLVVPLSPEEIEQERTAFPKLFEDIEISCYNSPSMSVVSGAETSCKGLMEHFQQSRNVKCQFVRGSIPFHSKYMEPIKNDMLNALSFLDSKFTQPVVPLISTVKAVSEVCFDKYYWWLNTRFAVKFNQAITHVINEYRPTAFVEISPHITLRSNVRDITSSAGVSIPYLTTLIKGEDGSQLWSNFVGLLFEHSLNMDWKTLYPNPMYIKLPNYPFDNKICRVIQNDEAYYKLHGPFGAGPFLGRQMWTHDKIFEVVVSASHFPFLKQHVVENVPLVPAAGYIELVLEAMGGEPCTIRDIQFSAACPVTDAPRLLQIKFTTPDNTTDPMEFKITSTTSKFDQEVPWTLHCSGTVQKRISPAIPEPIATMPTRFTERMYNQKEFYQRIPEEAFHYGPDFQVIKDVQADPTNGHFWVKIETPEAQFEAHKKAGWNLHPFVLDGVLQSYIGMVNKAGRTGIPYCMEEFEFYGAPKSHSLNALVTCPATWTGGLDLGVSPYGDAFLYDADGTLICALKNYKGLVTPQKEAPKGNLLQKWQNKSLDINVAKLLSQSMEQQADLHFSSSLFTAIQQSLQQALGVPVVAVGADVEMEYELSPPEILKLIEKSTSPHKDYMKYLLEISTSTSMNGNGVHMSDSTDLLLDYSTTLPALLKRAGTNLTPEWVFSPFASALKSILLEVLSSNQQIVRVLEVCNNSTFSVLTNLEGVEIKKPVEYFVASSSSSTVSAIVDQASQVDFPVRSLVKDFESGITLEGVPYHGFFDLIIVNTPTTLSAEESATGFLKSYRQFIAPGGLLAVTGFSTVTEVYKTLAVSPKMILPSFLDDVSKAAGFSSCNALKSKNSPHAVALMHASASLAPGVDYAHNKLVVFADSKGFYDAMTLKPASCVRGPNWDLASNIDSLITKTDDVDILHLWSIDDTSDFAVTSYMFITDLARGILKNQPTGKVNVWIVTNNAALETSNVHSGALWGLIRTVAQEMGDMPNVRFYLVDVGAPSDMKVVELLVAAQFGENECVVRNGKLLVSRLVAVVPAVKDSSVNNTIMNINPSTTVDIPFRLEPSERAQLGSIAFHTYNIPLTPANNQVLVRVHYAALNFRDLMVGLDRLAWQSYEKSALGKNLGIECSGEVLAVGPNITSLKVGDKVMATTGGTMANLVLIDQKNCFGVPSNINMAEASSLLSVYLTAYYALIHMARLSKGKTCLVHSGMGGVGLATIGLAKHFGFDVYSTAGTDAKRQSLLNMGCKGVYDSHNYTWAAQLLADTNGRGVDAVLNSLAGNHIELGVNVLAEGGWFCEIGKRDIYANSKVGMYALRKNVTITAVDTDRLLVTHPVEVRQITQVIVELFASGQLPTIPVDEYPVHDYLSALRKMQSGKHTGKLVLNMRDSTPLPVLDHRPLFSANATYIVTGGLGGFGLRFLAFLYENGARNLIMTDYDAKRRRTPEWLKKAARLGDDMNIQIEFANVHNYADVERVVNVCKQKNLPLRGVFHLAAVLADANLMSQDRELYIKSLEPKAMGALNLHKATQGLQLDYFVLISSIASALGSASQANYSAANAFIDSLARHRRALGLKASTFNMGAILDAGMASRDMNTMKVLISKGIIPIGASAALAALDYQLRNDITEMIGANLNLDIKFNSSWGYCANGYLSVTKAGEGAIGMSQGVIVSYLCRQIQKLTGVSEVSPALPLSSFGIDSMIGTELSIWLKDKFNISLSAVKLMTSATCDSITQLILSNNAGSSQSASSSSQAAAASSQTASATIKAVPPMFHIPMKQLFARAANAPRTSPMIVEMDDGSSAMVVAKSPNKEVEHVKQDIEQICSAFQTFIASNPTPAPASKSISTIFITGVTGFVGRVFLARVLAQKPDLKAVCIARASNDKAAMERIKSALEEAGYWKENYRSNIVAIAGDLTQDNFGLSSEAFANLSASVDSIYHYAASTSLVDPYSVIRTDNTLVMLNLFMLATTKKIKHFHHVSTLAVFPEYISGFPNASEFSQKQLMESDDPDLEALEQLIPPDVLGYPWSKWACEQIVRRCSSMGGIPAAVYRIPWTTSTSDTGYTSEISSCVSIAAMQEGLIPASSLPISNSAVDVICDIVLSLSLASRKHITYHVVSKEVRHWTALWRWMNETGFEVKHIDNEQAFLDSGQKPGSPLKKILPLLELMRSTWYQHKRELDDPIIKNGLPISTANVEGDYGSVKWPATELVSAKSWLWVLSQGEKWPYQLPKVSLHVQGLLQHLQAYTGLSYMGPNSFYEGLERLVHSMDNEANLSNIGRVIVRQDIWRRLMNRLHLFKEISRNPCVSNERIKRPVIILGMNRTGTTLLHRLLAQDERFRAPYFFEMLWPIDVWEDEQKGKCASPKCSEELMDYIYSSSADPRLKKAHMERDARKLVLDETNHHVVEAYLPEEDFAIMRHDIQCLSWTASCNIPSFRQWLTTQANMSTTYAFHKLFLQFLQSTGRNVLSPGSKEYSWLLKFPMHMMFIKYIFETYPDVTIIQTHRAPHEVMPSWCGLVNVLRSYSLDVEKSDIGATQLDAMREMLDSTLKFRNEHPELSDRFIDVRYTNLVSKPMECIKQIYERLDMPITPQLAEKFKTHLEASQKHKSTTSKATLEEYGLTREMVDGAFAPYIKQFNL